MNSKSKNDKFYISNRSTYFINKYITSVFFLIVVIIMLFIIIFTAAEYILIMFGTLILFIPIVYWLFLSKFLFIKHLYIENDKLYAEDRGKKIQIHLENIQKFRRNYFFYHSGLYCLILKKKTDFGKKIYFTIEV